ncbi:glycosyltransferase [Aeromonas hydrophila]|uniref:glycosyltransferase n=1 Tax=Aeromonas hydrophila TaxID=644 RepID=UPI00207D1C79|nr:glycosyltransferase [Aeromonas hydrophila]MCO4213434.1 glycosyltransferase [Aeromonas hydrophila]WKK54410.1 glycosyltransferase class 2 [Aeromonas hydrophila]HDX8443082.1 glycosyltransferase [Aeromonas hydrophila]HDX8633970.1 glycosyltransferase [Aeromonas hydrophila]
MQQKKKVGVLLAAFNGEPWLAEQVLSILEQKCVDVHLYISLDKSDDSSMSICNKFCLEYKNVTLLPYGDTFGGAGKNFYRLFIDVDISDYDFIALSDQDDIWNPDKLISSVDILSEYDGYSSNVIAFWEDGRETLINKAQEKKEWDYLFEAAGPGCTYVLRRDVAIKFKTWLIEHYDKITHDIALHDWLIYAFCRHFGYRWFIDPRPGMRYRQHANNQVGTNNSISAAQKRLLLIKRKWYRNQVTKIAEHLELQNLSMVKYGLNKGYIGNLYLLFNVNQLRRRLRDRIALSFALLFNIF